eukprot:gene541-582_t
MPEFKIYDVVNTAFGTGYIHAIRSDCYVVLLTNWALAQGQSPTLFLQADAIKHIPGALPRTTVSTTYGHAQLQKIRYDNVHIAKPLNWKLANDTSATLYLQPDGVKLQQTAGFNEGDEVMTVYGQGYIYKKRENDLVVKLRDWKLAQGQSPTLYLNLSAVVKVPGLKVGDVAKTVYGLVKIIEIRRDGTHVAKAVHWSLANHTAPTFHLAPEAFALLSIKP